MRRLWGALVDRERKVRFDSLMMWTGIPTGFLVRAGPACWREGDAGKAVPVPESTSGCVERE